MSGLVTMSSTIRTFSVIDILKHGDCKTKFKHKYYHATTTRRAAKKVFADLCKLKNIHGICAFNIKIQDSTKNGQYHGNVYHYHVNRKFVQRVKRKGNKETLYKCSKIRTYSLKNPQNKKFNKQPS